MRQTSRSTGIAVAGAVLAVLFEFAAAQLVAVDTDAAGIGSDLCNGIVLAAVVVVAGTVAVAAAAVEAGGVFVDCRCWWDQL